MPPIVASALCCVLIAGLFWLNRDPDEHTSWALWVPVLWFGLASSRSVSQWLQFSQGATADAVAEGSPVDRAVYFGLVLLAFIIIFAQHRKVGRLLRVNGSIVLFFAYCLISLTWSDYPDVGFKRWIKALGDLAMVLIVLTDPQPLAAFKRLLTRVAYVLIPVSIVLIKYYPEIGVGYTEFGGRGVISGVTLGKNALGALCLLYGLGAFWLFTTDFRNQETPFRSRRLLAHGILLVMVVWLLWTANSMTSITSLAMSATLFIVASRPFARRIPAVIPALVITMVTASYSVVFLGASPNALAAIGRDPTLTDRTEVWGILRSLADNPIAGTGFESFWLGKRLQTLWDIYWWHPNEAHNGYLEIFLQLGWIGIALLMVVILTGYRNAYRKWRADPSVGSLCLAYFFVALVYNFTEAAWFKILAPVWLFFLLGVVGEPIFQTSTANESPVLDSASQGQISSSLVKEWM
jgi:O-antigen ligase